ncbi:hypothetical protein DPMN_176555 [Dreissena polymorpha]|uniref:Uncharacterized protein n=1 Tax=Dreissena polymorpha TaxID=45954 RepID=A0A9D4EBI7_DREPO|nr:hypothetical protein DPMN_176555 [Dreissena polymorpha]
MTQSDFPSSLGQSRISYHHTLTSAVDDSYQTLKAKNVTVPALYNMFFLNALQLCHNKDTDGATATSSERLLTGLNTKVKRNAVTHRDNS